MSVGLRTEVSMLGETFLCLMRTVWGSFFFFLGFIPGFWLLCWLSAPWAGYIPVDVTVKELLLPMASPPGLHPGVRGHCSALGSNKG